ncbi:MAG: NAD(P)H-dependent oxidoreductase subunit E [Trueperaceae bacterium]|nr:NAD(P)H-dependent oxidoreductase subunit E [Trueperaceae bacterium]
MIELSTVRPFFEDKPDVLQEILGRYPDYGRRSALMPLLWEVQRAERYVSEARIAEIADILDLTATEVRGVMSFYSTYHGDPVGRYHLQVCATLSCKLAGADELADHLEDTLGLVPGETDAEGRFSLQKVECLGSCTTAPVLQINDAYYERVGRADVDALINAMKHDALPEPARVRAGDNEGYGAGGPPAAPTGPTAPTDPTGPTDPTRPADAGEEDA